jgi:3-hydroxyisobutyrate dehydrogenase-like beta-hydroxyacid dehydrogenase
MFQQVKIFANLGRNYERGFGCELMLKDLKIADECAKKINAEIALGKMSKDIYQKLTD